MTTSVTRKKLPLRCPACDAPLRVSKMICGRCTTEVSGEFELPVLTSLNEEEQRFMLEFVKASGSLKDMAKKMGVSYPTVRHYLDDLIEKLNNMEENER